MQKRLKKLRSWRDSSHGNTVLPMQLHPDKRLGGDESLQRSNNRADPHVIPLMLAPFPNGVALQAARNHQIRAFLLREIEGQCMKGGARCVSCGR